ncbi:DDE-type integrase/transposase/recombinase [uncultured Dokdonia sp.]|uniref:DDE-type integrase/transposase/recombinase n=1 Tax=uncultured Dokdonia sp. TaxID=575653 RepID=UPI002632F154|nr:DDE-type integrase/transposase/recombinase [uncultured Dokdonia sp.]
MQKYKKYHSNIKTSYALGIHKQVLPDSFTRDISHSTSHYWKHESPDKYIGSEFASSIENSLDDTKVFLDKRLEFGRKAFVEFGRIYLMILNLIGKENLLALIKGNRKSFVDSLENLSEDFPISKATILRFIGISNHRYRSWLNERKSFCTHSLIGQCFKRRPNQISPKEIRVLKQYMNNPNYKIWCIRSVWGKAIREGAISMAESTWYKYVKKLGYSKSRKPAKKPRKKGSYNASAPNETWHMDISQYRTLDNVVFYIYTVVDNFSRKIITYDISTIKSAKIRTDTLRSAISEQFNVDLQGQHVDLIVDGGSENNNKTVHQFLRECQINIHKKIALKDVTFSNSIVEGPYKIMKSYYFRTKQILSTTIHEELAIFIKNYNDEKPCNKHKIYTPSEVHDNPELTKAKLVIGNFNQERIANNRNYCCKVSA